MLEIKGMVYCDGTCESGVIINVYEDNQKISHTKTNIFGRFNVDLAMNKYYTVELAKHGCVTKRIVFDTKLPGHVKDLEIFPMDVEIFRRSTLRDISELDYPVGVVKWIDHLNTFHDYVPYSNEMRALQFELLGTDDGRKW